MARIPRHRDAQNLPIKWNAQEGVTWTVKLPGYGQSGPVIWRDRVFVTSTVGNNKETAVGSCVDLQSGRALWRKDLKNSAPARVTGYISRAAPTPAVDATTGKQVWIVEDIEGNTVPSATVTKDLVVVGSRQVGSNLAIRRGGKGT